MTILNGESRLLVTFGSLTGLLVGFALGAVAFESNHPLLIGLGSVLEPLGNLWTNGLRMIILPLMCSCLFLGIATARDVGKAGRIGARTILLFAVLLGAALVFSLVLVPPLFERLVIDDATREALARFADRGAPTGGLPQAELDSWLPYLIPPNLVAAAARDQFLAVILATVLFALAARRISEGRRSQLILLLQAISEATLVVVGWLLRLMPLGVLALTYGIALESGFSLAGALGYSVLVESSLLLIFTLLLYFLPVFVGRTPVGRFAWGILPAQLVAVSTRSSLATLPSLMNCADKRLGLDRDVIGLVLPLSVSTFKLDVAITSFTGLFFLARLHEIDLTTEQIAAFTAGTLLFSLSAPGIPTGGFPFQAPLYLAVGIPLESTMVLSAIGVLPDVFQTLLNITADISIASIVNRWQLGIWRGR